MANSRSITRSAVMDAYQGLSQTERETLDFWASVLDAKMENVNETLRFSHSMALELLGKIGMLICQSSDARFAVNEARVNELEMWRGPRPS